MKKRGTECRIHAKESKAKADVSAGKRGKPASHAAAELGLSGGYAVPLDAGIA